MSEAGLDIPRLKDRLKISEGVRPKVYLDSVGIPTIGVGRNLRDVGLSDSEIDILLENDIKRTMESLDAKLPWWKSLDPVRQSVLADMCFNMGINKLLGFVNTLRFVQAGDYIQAARNMEKSLWYKQVGNRAKHLVAMMETGKE
jgi:lysozyme